MYCHKFKARYVGPGICRYYLNRPGIYKGCLGWGPRAKREESWNHYNHLHNQCEQALIDTNWIREINIFIPQPWIWWPLNVFTCNSNYDMIWYDIWYDMIWYGMGYDIWYDMIWYMIYDIWYMIWYDMIWYDMIWYDMIWYILYDVMRCDAMRCLRCDACDAMR